MKDFVFAELTQGSRSLKTLLSTVEKPPLSLLLGIPVKPKQNVCPTLCAECCARKKAQGRVQVHESK